MIKLTRRERALCLIVVVPAIIAQINAWTLQAQVLGIDAARFANLMFLPVVIAGIYIRYRYIR